MRYTTHLASFDPIRRRMAQSGGSMSPGFPGIISAVDTDSRTVDVWVQGSSYTLKKISYQAQGYDKPSYITVGSCVYIRHSSGSKFQFEVSGPSNILPTVSAGVTPIPTMSGDPDIIISGLDVVQSSSPGMTVAITIGKARLGGVLYEFLIPNLGENLDAKVSGASPGIMKVGYGSLVGQTYVYIPIDAAPTAGLSRYDSIELDISDQLLYYRNGVAAVAPAPLVPLTGNILLSIVLVRTDTTSIMQSDIDGVLSQTSAMISVTPKTSEIFWEGFPDPEDYDQAFVVQVSDQYGNLLVGEEIRSRIYSGGGVLGPTTIFSDSNGIAYFTYTREIATVRSAILRFESIVSGSYDEARVTNYDPFRRPYPV